MPAIRHGELPCQPADHGNLLGRVIVHHPVGHIPLGGLSRLLLVISHEAVHGRRRGRRRLGGAEDLHVDVGPQLSRVGIGNVHRSGLAVALRPHRDRVSITVWVALLKAQSVEADRPRSEAAKHAVERSVLQHEDDQVFDVIECRHAPLQRFQPGRDDPRTGSPAAFFVHSMLASAPVSGAMW